MTLKDAILQSLKDLNRLSIYKDVYNYLKNNYLYEY